MKRKTYTDQHTPYAYYADVSFDGLDTRDRGHLIEHLAPIGSQWFTLCCGTQGTVERIKIVEDALIRAHINS